MGKIEIEMKYKITDKVYEEIIGYFKIKKINVEKWYFFSPIYFSFIGGDWEYYQSREKQKYNLIVTKVPYEISDNIIFLDEIREK